MKLHEDKAAFRVLLSEINRQTGYRMDILEKDYYVALPSLDNVQHAPSPYFYGFTALSSIGGWLRRLMTMPQMAK